MAEVGVEMKKIFRIALALAVLVVTFLPLVVSAATTYTHVQRITITDTSGVDRAGLPVVLAGIQGGQLLTTSYIQADGLDTMMLDSNYYERSYMMHTSRVNTVIPLLSADGTVTYDLYMGTDTLQSIFPLIFGSGGYLTVVDDPSLEPDSDPLALSRLYLLLAEAQINPTVNGNLYNKPGSIVIGINGGELFASVYDDTPVTYTVSYDLSGEDDYTGDVELRHQTVGGGVYELQLYYNGVEVDSEVVVGLDVVDNGNSVIIGSNAMPVVEYVLLDISGTAGATEWGPLSEMMAGDILYDIGDGAFGNDGIVTWGTNTDLTIVYGEVYAGPTVLTIGAHDITPASAYMQGSLVSMSGNSFVSVSFEYGRTVAYGDTTGEQNLTAPATFDIQVSGLRYGQTYHFRAVARVGTLYFYGADATFTTKPAEGSSTVLDIMSVGIFQTYKAAGDMLITVEIINTYTSLFPTRKAGDYFHVQLLETDGITIIAASPLSNWGDRPSSIYLKPALAATLTVQAAYFIRVIGVNVPGTPYSDYEIVPEDWKGTDLTSLDYWCRGTAMRMQITDNRTDYLTGPVDQMQVISDAAGGYFTAGIPGIMSVRPNLFETSVVVPDTSAGTSGNTWDDPNDWETYVGANIVADVTTFALPWGVNGKTFMSGMVYLVVIGFMIITVAGTGGFGALGAGLIAVPILWLATYFRILDYAVITIICIIFGAFAVRQFLIKTL